MTTEKSWFAPKRYGYGAGLPIAWQGWAVLIGYIVGLAVAGRMLLPLHPVLWAAVLTGLTIALIVIAAKRTRGGWHWRTGK